jgi:NADH:ubiquinone oxidoreductase subunit F (NADH-binding)
MSQNLSQLSFRRGLENNVFDRLVDAAATTGSAEAPDLIRPLGEASLFGDAVTLGAVSFYDFLKKENAGKKVFLCNGSACLCAGTQQKLHHEMERHFAPDEIGHICCLGRCHSGGAFQYEGRNYSGQSPAQIENLRETGEGDSRDRYAVVSALKEPLLTADFPGIEAFYAPLRALFAAGQDAFFDELKASKLRGRGGAGFPVHLKWQSCRETAGPIKYIVCNADEGDPGAYIDKYLMEEQPHAVLLGMLVAGWFCGAGVGVLYIRAEYPDSVTRINAAIADLQSAGWLGKNIQGSGFDFEFKTIKGAGAYICGEETALLASIEGQRPEVRVRPPFPTQQGLFLRPTVVNNVETFANLRPLLQLGGTGYAAIGTEMSTGPKLLSLDSGFKQPGIYEVAMGTPLEDVFDSLAGGFWQPIKAVQIGGPLGGLIPVSRIGYLTVDFESFKNAGFLLGHAGVVSIPERFPMIEYLQHLFQFTADESCGKCFPCRLGSTRGKELIAKARADDAFKIDRELLDDLLDTLEQTSLCALGGGVPLPIKNALHYFEDELRGYFKQ